jgi:hypothetical protein
VALTAGLAEFLPFPRYRGPADAPAGSEPVVDWTPVAGRAGGPTEFVPSLRHRRPVGQGSTADHVDHVSRFLSGRMSAAEARTGPEPEVDWTPLLGRVGCLAWFAALPTTPPQVREALAGFLDRWSGTVFADRGPVLDTGVLVGTERPGPREEAGGRRLAPGGRPRRVRPPPGRPGLGDRRAAAGVHRGPR